MRRLFWALTVVSFWSASGIAHAQPLGPICGVLDDEELFVSCRGKQDGKPDESSSLHRGRWEVVPTQIRETYTEYGRMLDLPENLSDQRVHVEKITLASHRFWFTGPRSEAYSVIPIEDLPLFEFSAWGRRLRSRRFGPDVGIYQVQQKYQYDVCSLLWGGETVKEYSRAHGAWAKKKGKPDPFAGGALIDPLTGVPPDLTKERDRFIRDDLHFDLIPTGAKRATLITCGKTLEIQQLVIGDPPTDKDGDRAHPLPKTKLKSDKPPFKGDFWAYQVRDAYYLLSLKDGTLHSAKANDKGVLEVGTIWKFKDRPIIGAIQDIKGNTIRFFGSDEAKGKGRRFTFEAHLIPDITNYKTEAKSGDGFREVQDCVRFIKKPAKR